MFDEFRASAYTSKRQLQPKSKVGYLPYFVQIKRPEFRISILNCEQLRTTFKKINFENIRANWILIFA